MSSKKDSWILTEIVQCAKHKKFSVSFPALTTSREEKEKPKNYIHLKSYVYAEQVVQLCSCIIPGAHVFIPTVSPIMSTEGRHNPCI